jgi:hypothetical protein
MRFQLVTKEDQMNAWSSMPHISRTAIAALASLDRDDLSARNQLYRFQRTSAPYRGIAT